MVFDAKARKWIFTHLLADKYNLENNMYAAETGAHKHHKDFNKLNNNPDNIIRMTTETHLQLHRKHIKLTLHRDEAIEKCNKIKKSPEYRIKISRIMKEKLSGLLSERAKKQWQNPEYKNYMVKKFLDFYYSNELYRNETIKILNNAQKEYWLSGDNRKKQSNRVTGNLKSILKTSRKKDWLSDEAKKQWQDSSLLEWRKNKTKQQWTNEFRGKEKRLTVKPT